MKRTVVYWVAFCHLVHHLDATLVYWRFVQNFSETRLLQLLFSKKLNEICCHNYIKYYWVVHGSWAYYQKMHQKQSMICLYFCIQKAVSLWKFIFRCSHRFKSIFTFAGPMINLAPRVIHFFREVQFLRTATLIGARLMIFVTLDTLWTYFFTPHTLGLQGKLIRRDVVFANLKRK